MKHYGRTSVSEFLGDNVIYRNLSPIDTRLPSLDDLRDETGVKPGITPRKSTTEYAQVVAGILTAARKVDAPDVHIRRIIFIGDTRLNDSTAFVNICQTGSWPGQAFIGAENSKPQQIDIEDIGMGAVMVANRWRALSDFQQYLVDQNFPVDENTTILLDLDKTTLGARGRNDHVINQTRVDAAVLTLSDALGSKFNKDQFQTVYDQFNQTNFHPFTTDNQDYLVYICLMIGAGLFSQYGLECALSNQIITDFDSFMQQVERRSVELPPEIRQVHQDVYQRVQSGDPTPFKAFRRAEFQATAARMGQMKPGTPVSELLSQEIVITHEIQELILPWREQGALLFGLSDKPDEASIPTPDLASQGYLPIHQIETDVIGV